MIQIQRSRTKRVFCPEVVCCSSWENHLQRSLVSHLKSKLEFHVWLIRFSVRTKRPWSCLGLGCHFSSRYSHYGWLGVGDLLNIPFINKHCITEEQTDNFQLFIGIWVDTSLIFTWDKIQIVTLLQFIMLKCWIWIFILSMNSVIFKLAKTVQAVLGFFYFT